MPGVSLSDHRNYWQAGFPALMITDGSFYRNPHYHTPEDTLDKVCPESLDAVGEAAVEVLPGIG